MILVIIPTITIRLCTETIIVVAAAVAHAAAAVPAAIDMQPLGIINGTVTTKILADAYHRLLAIAIVTPRVAVTRKSLAAAWTRCRRIVPATPVPSMQHSCMPLTCIKQCQ